MQNNLNEPRRKTWKREFAVGTFFGCLFWSMYTGDNDFLSITFSPSLAIAGAVMGLHEISENILKRNNRENRRASFADRYVDQDFGEGFEK